MIRLLFSRALLLTLLGITLFSDLMCMRHSSHSSHRSSVFDVESSVASSSYCDEFSSDSHEENEDQENKVFNQIPGRSSLSFEKMEASCRRNIPQYSDFVGRAGFQIFNDVNKALDFIRVFNCNALKRNDEKLEQLYIKFLEILKIESCYGDKAYLYFQDWQIDNLIMHWYLTDRVFVNRITRIALKVNLFEALNFLEKIISHLNCKTIALKNGLSKLDQLDIQFKSTRNYIAQRICTQR